MSDQNNQNEELLSEDQVSLSSEAQESEGAPEERGEGDSSAGSPESEAVAKLKDELLDAKEQALRAAAEMQNVRRRAQQDVEKAHKFGLEKFVGDVLPVADNLERAIEASRAEGADMKVVAEGVELTLKGLLDALQRHQVAQVDPVGEPFDPQLHQAMSMVANPEVEPNSVINVFQKGYTLHGRLVRPAMVVVASAPAQKK